MRVVLDTNVIVSSFLSLHGAPAKIIEHWRQHAFDVLVSESILSEYQRVLGYKHIQSLHKMTSEEITDVIEDFRKFAIMVAPKRKLHVVTQDLDDNKFLECAVEGEAAYIISGDSHLLVIEQFQGIQILPPAPFLVVLQEEE